MIQSYLPSLLVGVNVWDQIAASGFIVQFVLFLLVVMSVMTWAIIGFKTRQLKRAIADTDDFLGEFWESKNLETAADIAKALPASPVANLFIDVFRDLRQLRKDRQSDPEDTNLRDMRAGSQGIERTIQSRTNQESLRLEKWLTFLATTAAAAPFIGLFGTVWGIMDAFAGIGETGSASLAVVAGPISEALIATAAGLAAAIPAVAAYNYLLGLVRNLQADMDNFGLEILNLCERHFLK